MARKDSTEPTVPACTRMLQCSLGQISAKCYYAALLFAEEQTASVERPASSGLLLGAS